MKSIWNLVRFGRLLSLVLWVGGIAFFAFAVAPVAFGRLADAHAAGLVVGGTLRVLHGIGLVCGAVFVVLTLAFWRRSGSRAWLGVELTLMAGMILVTAVSQFRVLPLMETYRVEVGGDISMADRANPSRVRFERLHVWSERMEGAVLLGGLVVLFGMSSEETGRER